MLGVPRQGPGRLQHFGHQQLAVVVVERFAAASRRPQLVVPRMVSGSFQEQVVAVVFDELATDPRGELLQCIGTIRSGQHFKYPVVLHDRVPHDAFAIQRPTITSRDSDIDGVISMAADEPTPVVAGPNWRADAVNRVGVVDAFQRGLLDMPPKPRAELRWPNRRIDLLDAARLRRAPSTDVSQRFAGSRASLREAPPTRPTRLREQRWHVGSNQR